jgi:hypothetical protein
LSGNYPVPNENNLTKLVRSIRDLFEGRSNAMGTFTCTENQATTTVSHPNVGPESRIIITPTTANGATELGAGTIYISAKALGSFTVTHANAATLTRTFDYAIVG